MEWNSNETHTPHPLNTARGGIAILIKENIGYYEENILQIESTQAANVRINTISAKMSITALYIPQELTQSHAKIY